MLPCNPGGHAAYQDTFVSDFLKFYPNPFSLPKITWDYIVQFWYLDLSQTDSIMQNCYSVFGPPPRLPSCMLRSYLLALKLKISSITDWCRMLRENPLYAGILISSYGCSPQTAHFDFKFALSKTNAGDENKAYHMIQSFLPGEVDFDTAHQIGIELADKVLEGNIRMWSVRILIKVTSITTSFSVPQTTSNTTNITTADRPITASAA